MTFILSNRSGKFFIGSITLLIVICSTLSIITLDIENKLYSLQSNYRQLAIDNNNLNSRLNNMQSSLNQINEDIIAGNSQERITISRVTSPSEGKLTVSARSLSGVDVVIVDAIVRKSILDNTIGNVIAQNSQMPQQIIPASRTIVHFDISFPNADFDIGYAYTITLISQKGDSFTSAPFTLPMRNPTPSPQPLTP